MSEHQLSASPSLASVYASVVPRVLRRVKEVSPDSLPRDTVVVSGVVAGDERLLAYQRLMGDVIRDEVPSVLLHGLGFPAALWLMARSDFPLPLLGLVHLSNHVNHHRRVGPHELLTVTAAAESLQAHHAGVSVTMRTSLSVGDELVWEGRSVYLAKGVRLSGHAAPPAPERAPFEAPSVTGRWRLAADTGRRFAAVLGDYNPIHLSTFSAKALGLKSSIAHGMYLAGRALVSQAPHAGGYSWDIEFATPVFLPSVVQVHLPSAVDGASSFAGWDGKRLKPHFTGSVRARV